MLVVFDPATMTTAETWMALSVRDLGSGDPGSRSTYLASEINKPLNDPTIVGSYGARKRPDILDPGTVSRAMSDLITGDLPHTTQTLLVADAKRFWRDLREIHGGNFNDAEFWYYLTTRAWRLTGGAPLPLNHGYITADAMQPSLGWQLVANDQLGNARRLHTKRLMIPQRTIRGGNSALTPVFVNWNDPDPRNPRAVPWSFGSSDEGIVLPPGYVTGGVIPAICLNEMTMADATTWVIGLVQGHDAKDGIIALYQPEGALDASTSPHYNGLIPDADPDACWPGQITAGWATINPSGASLVTVLDGETFLLFAVKGTRAAAFKDGTRPIYANVRRPTSNGAGTGTEMSADGSLLKRWALINWILRTPSYMTGAYYTTSPRFDFYPSKATVDVVDMDSFTRSSGIWTGLGGGIQWGGVVGLSGEQRAAEDVIADMNRSSNPMAWSGSGQLKDCAFDFTRASFLRTATILDAVSKRGIIGDPAFSEDQLHDLFTNNDHLSYAFNGRTGLLQGDVQQGGNAEQFLQHDTGAKDITAPFILNETGATLVAQALLDLLSGRIPSISRWGRTWAGHEDDIGDGRAITHFNGNGGAGYVDAAHWILDQDYDIKNGRVLNAGLYVEPALS